MKINAKNTIKAAAATAGAMALSATPAFAAFSNPLKFSDICEGMSIVTDWIIGIAAGIALILLVMGGVQYMTSGGDKVAVENSRGRITAAVVGLVIVFGAWLVINTILGIIATSTTICK